MKNYFEIFSAADKEMIHSAMLAELLKKPFFRKRLLSNINLPEQILVEREKKLPPYPDRFDLLILDPANDNRLLLVLENKFKSLSTATQLQKYDKILEDEKYATSKKYLLVFNSCALGDCLEAVSGWNVLSYREVMSAIQEYLAENPELEEREKSLLQEYVDYLESFIKKYDEMIANPTVLENWKDNPDYKFFRRLFMGNLASRINEKLPELKISNNSGGAQEPLLDIYDSDWNKNSGEKWPQIFIQLQGDKIKFYLRWRKAGEKATTKNKLKDDEKQKILDYIKRLKEFKGINMKLIENRLNGAAASCSICSRPFILADNMADCVKQVVDFYNQINKVVHVNGKCC